MPVYALCDLGGNVRYVGKTAFSVERRIKEHVACARSGGTLPLHAWLRKHDFGFEVRILDASPFDLNAAEVYWIEMHNTYRGRGGLNCTLGGDGGVTRIGYTHTAETRSKISAKLRNPSAETRLRKSLANMGNRHSVESRAKMSTAKKGRTLSAEHRAKIATGLARRREEGLPVGGQVHQVNTCQS